MVNLIRKDTWEKLSLPAPRPPPPLHVYGIDGEVPLNVIGIADIPITLFRGDERTPYSRTTPFMIVPTCTDPTVLGRPALMVGWDGDGSAPL